MSRATPTPATRQNPFASFAPLRHAVDVLPGRGKKEPPGLAGGLYRQTVLAEMVCGMHHRTDACSLGAGTAGGKGTCG